MDHKLYRKILILFLFFIVFVPQYAFAHAILEKATPTPNSHVKVPPKEVVLLFNERLEEEFYSIKVFNADGDIVTNNKTQLSIDQRNEHKCCHPLPMGHIRSPIGFFLLMDIQ